MVAILTSDWFRWDREEIRFSEKNQKAIDVLRTSCLKLKSLVSETEIRSEILLYCYCTELYCTVQVLCDSKLYEIIRANFERAELLSVVRTTVLCCTVLYGYYLICRLWSEKSYFHKLL